MKKILTFLLATLFTISAFAQSPKFSINFVKTRSEIKGTWETWPSKWNTPTAESYIQLSMITENKVYNVRYYEAGKKVKDLDVTYNSKKTEELRKQWNKTNVHAYQVNDKTGHWLVLQGPGPFSLLYKDPQKWMSANDACLYFWEGSKQILVK